MIRRHIMNPLREGRGEGAPGAPGAAVWVAVGRRLARRRTELGYGTERVAQWAGIPAETYESYEKGAPIPAALLGQIADLFERPIVWFFEGVAQPEALEDDPGPSPQPVVYRVATVEHRIQALADSFRKLDFEGQQHLLAISQALTRSNASVARD
jgi:transcriptional regulator with XRE-family HTH domain